jgi:hypothetical protein
MAEIEIADEAAAYLVARQIGAAFERTVNAAVARLFAEVERYVGGPAPNAARVVADALRQAADRVEQAAWRR